MTGSLPRGKASLQVIQVRDTTSKCLITRAVPGRPVVRTDVIANAVGTYAHDLGALGESAPSAAPRGAAGAADASPSAHGPGAAE